MNFHEFLMPFVAMMTILASLSAVAMLFSRGLAASLNHQRLRASAWFVAGLVLYSALFSAFMAFVESF